MNAAQIHLALTHVPVILSFVGLILLAVFYFKKNETLAKTSFYILLMAGLFTIPVYITGEGTEDMVENLPGVTENIIEKHEEFAQFALIIISIGGAIALAAILLHRNTVLGRIAKLMLLVVALGSSATMAWTAHLGGQIRHTEIRSGFTVQNEKENGTQNVKGEKDDD